MLHIVILSSIKQYNVEDEQFIQVKEQFRIGGLSEDEKCNLSFALAKMYEDIGDLNQAFNHLSKGNALRKKLLNYSIKIDKSLFSSLKKTQPNLLKSSKIKKDLGAFHQFLLLECQDQELH